MDNDILDYFKPGKLYRAIIDTHLIHVENSNIVKVPKDSILVLLGYYVVRSKDSYYVESVEVQYLLNKEYLRERYSIIPKTWRWRFELIE